MLKTRQLRTSVAVLILVAVLSSNLSQARPRMAGAATPARQIAIGVSMRPDRNPAELDKFIASIGGRAPAIVSIWSDWGGSISPFPAWMAGELAKRKIVPMIFWQPVDSANLGSPAFAYSRILAGDHDAYIRQWARDAKAFGGDVIARLAHEMDGYWFPWGMGRFDNTPTNFIAAWRHIFQIVRVEVGATNVKFLWSPYTPKGSVYPGDAYVDFVGFSRFNWGSVHDAPWQTMKSLFADPVQRATNITSKPIIVAETGSTPIAGDKANWVTNGYQSVYDAYPTIKAIVYFNVNTLPGQVDWRLQTPPAARAAYADIAADPRFQGTIGKPGNPPPPTNRPPTAAVALSPANPTTDQTLTATVTASDPDGDAINLDYVWKVNGAVKRTLTTTARTDTFNLATAGNGDPGQTISLEVTPRDAKVAGATAVKSVTVSAVGTPITYVSDPFSRTLTDTWGAIATGGPYMLEGKVGTYDVGGGVGTMSVGARANRSAVLGTVLARDVDISFRVAADKVSVGGAQFVYGIARRVNASNDYLIKVRMPTSGGVYLQGIAVVDNVQTTLGSEFLVPGLAHTAGGFIRIRAQVTGSSPTTIRIRAWADGNAEPANWQYSVTNSAAGLQVAGAVGVATYLASTATNGPVLFSFDDLLVTSPSAPPPPPTNRPPTAAVVLSPANPTTTQTLTATVTASDPDGDAVNLDYVWKVDGAVKRTLTTTARTDTFDLAIAGNGDPGQVVSVAVTPSDATLDGATATKSVTVATTSGGVVTYVSDPFSRTATDKWGTITTGGRYTISAKVANYDVAGGVGMMALANGANRSAILGAISARDVDISFRVATNKVGAGDLQFAYALARVVGTSEYRVKLRLPADGTVLVQASSVTAGVETPISKGVTVPGLTHTAGSFIRVRAQVTGSNPTTIRMRAWVDGGAEPQNWQYSVTNSAAATQVSGAVGLRAYLGTATTNGPVVFSFDDLLVTSVGAPPPPPANRPPSAAVILSPANPGTDSTLTASVTASDPEGDTINLDYVWKVNGTIKRSQTTTARTDTFNLALAGNGDPGQIVSVEVTPRDATLTGPTATRAVTVATTGGPIVYASDPFSRTKTDTWGSIATGGPYTLEGSATDFDVAGGFGTMLLAARANRAAILRGISAEDVEFSFRVATDKLASGDAQFVYALARVVGTSEYRAKLRIETDGSVLVQASSVVGGVETPIGEAVVVPGLTHAPGGFLWVRAQITGTDPTTIRMRAWAAGKTEPTIWHLNVTNAVAGLQQAGAVGLRTYLPGMTTNGPVLFRFDDWRVTTIVAP
jgi:hypothetical protein